MLLKELVIERWITSQDWTIKTEFGMNESIVCSEAIDKVFPGHSEHFKLRVKATTEWQPGSVLIEFEKTVNPRTITHNFALWIGNYNTCSVYAYLARHLEELYEQDIREFYVTAETILEPIEETEQVED